MSLNYKKRIKTIESIQKVLLAIYVIFLIILGIQLLFFPGAAFYSVVLLIISYGFSLYINDIKQKYKEKSGNFNN